MDGLFTKLPRRALKTPTATSTAAATKTMILNLIPPDEGAGEGDSSSYGTNYLIIYHGGLMPAAPIMPPVTGCSLAGAATDANSPAEETHPGFIQGRAAVYPCLGCLFSWLTRPCCVT